MPAPGIVAARWIALLLPLALAGGALASEYWGGLVPCEMCHWQRWPHYAAIPVAALAFFVQHRFTRAMLILFAASLVAVSGAIGVFHAGVEYHWWQGITACSLHGGGSSLEELLKGPLVRCDEAQWRLLGISLAGWNAILSLAGAAAIFALVGRRRTL